MLLALDVGNTEITAGLFHGPELSAHWRLTTTTERTPDEWSVTLNALLVQAGHSPNEVRAAVMASVAPSVTQSLIAGLRSATGSETTTVDATTRLPIRLDVDEPLTVGADRIINTLAASRKYGRDAIVVDLGTATTFDCITRDAVFLGGVIAPGVRTSAETLFRRTSKLPATELVVPARVIGTRTEECIRAGVMFGAAESIDGIVGRIKTEWPSREVPVVIGTGGLAETFAPLCRSFDAVDPYLTLYGLSLAFALLENAH